MRYRQMLIDLRNLLAQHDVKVWPGRLSQWVDELDRSGMPIRNHVARTKKMISGPARLDDIIICAKNGHRVRDADDERAANARLGELLSHLGEETRRLLKT